MTKALKMSIRNEKEYIIAQNALFALGYTWKNEGKKVQLAPTPYLYAGVLNSKYIQSDFDEDLFALHPATEVFPNNCGSLTVSATGKFVCKEDIAGSDSKISKTLQELIDTYAAGYPPKLDKSPASPQEVIPSGIGTGVANGSIFAVGGKDVTRSTLSISTSDHAFDAARYPLNFPDAVSGMGTPTPKAPVGLRPAKFVRMDRIEEILGAMRRYNAADKQFPESWLNELIELNEISK